MRILCAFMPTVNNFKPWEIALRSQVNSLGKGWGVREDKGKTRIFHYAGAKQKVASLKLNWH